MTTARAGSRWTCALELAGELGRRGTQVDLAVFDGPLDTEQRWSAAALPGVRVHECAFRPESAPDPWQDLAQASTWLLEMEVRSAPDVVHLDAYSLADLPWRAPTVVTAHGCRVARHRALHGGETPAHLTRYAAAVRRGLRAARWLVAPTRSALDDLAADHGTLPRTTIVPHGRSRAAFLPRSKAPLVLSVASEWDERRDVAVLEHVAANLAWPVFMVGAERPASRPIRPLGHLCGEVLGQWLARTAVFVAPMRYTPFGVTVLEAALAGCALVLADLPALRETWGNAALFATPGDGAAFQAALQRVVHDPMLRATLGVRARERALELEIARTADAWVEVYADLLRASRTAARRRRDRGGSEPQRSIA